MNENRRLCCFEEHGIRIAHPMGVGVLEVNVWRLSMVKRPAECGSQSRSSGTSGKSGVVSDMAFDS